MEKEKAITILQAVKAGTADAFIRKAVIKDALDLAISALEKQIPKKPKHIDKNATFDGNWKKVCPACGRVLVERITTPEESYPEIYNHTPHCICGQAIDWEEK